MRRKAFTLIEVMVVLSILAIIAILAYNFFGGTMKEAKAKQEATKYYNDGRILTDAYDFYELDNPGWDRSLTSGWPTINDLVSGGYLKAAPTGSNGGSYTRYMDYMDFGGPSASNEALVEMEGISDEACRLYNLKYSNGIGDKIWDYTVDGPNYMPIKGTDMQADTACVDFGVNYVFWIFDYR